MATIKETAFTRSYSKVHGETFILPSYGGNKMHKAWDRKLLANCQHLKAGIDHYISFKLQENTTVHNYSTINIEWKPVSFTKVGV